jgi:hypothetical protein
LGCATLVITGAIATAPSAAAETVSPSTAPVVRFTSCNICGNMCGNPASYDNQRRIDTIVAETLDDTWGADQVFLSEVCRSQYDAIHAKLAPRGYNGLYTATLSGYSSICHGSD